MDAAGVVDKLGKGTDGRLAVGAPVIAYVIPFGPHGGTYAEKVVVAAASVSKADGLTVLADAVASDDNLVRYLGADFVVYRRTDLVEQIRRELPDGAPGLIDGAALDALALPAVADGGGLVTLKGWTGPSERGIVIHPVSSFGSATDTALFDRLRSQAEEGILTLRVAGFLPAAQAAEAHRRLAAAGVRGPLVLDFPQPL